MREVTFNRSDWSGRSETMQIQDNGSFVLMGYTFQLNRRPDQEDDLLTYCASITSEDHGKLGSVIRFKDEGIYTALEGGNDMNRDDPDPYVAAAKLICNLI